MRRTLSIAVLATIAVQAHADLILPYSGTDPTATLSSFQIIKSGTAGRANTLYISNASNTSDVLLVNTIGLGKAAYFSINNAANATQAVRGESNGTGVGVFGYMTGTGRAGVFRISNPGSANFALLAQTDGTGAAFRAQAGTGLAGDFIGGVSMLGTSETALTVTHNGNFPGIDAYSDGNVGVIGRSRDGYGVRGIAIGNAGVQGRATTGNGVEGSTTSGAGVSGSAGATSGETYGGKFSSASNAGVGAFGLATGEGGLSTGVRGESSSTFGRGVFGFASATNGPTTGVRGESSSTGGTGVFGFGQSGVIGQSQSISGRGVFGVASATNGITYGVWGQNASTSGRGVFGLATATSGNNYGVVGETASTAGRGVVGSATATSGTTYGVWGQNDSTSGRGVGGLAIGPDGRGVYGQANASGATDTPYGLRGFCSTATLGYAVYAAGDTGASGTKSFRIDHPLDPENKYLLHYSSESPFPQNFYNGNATTDAKGYAWVELPEYFADINTNLKYQLTVVDDGDSANFVQAKVSRKVQGNRFQIRTNSPRVEVSWMVFADRNDLRILANRPTDVREKTGLEKGKYQHPEYYGAGPEMGMDYQAGSSAIQHTSAPKRLALNSRKSSGATMRK